MDVERAVAVGEQEAAVGEEGEVGGQEAVAATDAVGTFVFAGGVDARLDRRVLQPDDFAAEVELGETFAADVRADVEELLAALVVNLEPVSAAAEHLAERADVSALGIEDEDRRMFGLLRRGPGAGRRRSRRDRPPRRASSAR